MYRYLIAARADKKVFYATCQEIDQHFAGGVSKKELLEDEHGSLLQKYKHQGKYIYISCDKYTDTVFVNSDVDLSSCLGSDKKIPVLFSL